MSEPRFDPARPDVPIPEKPVAAALREVRNLIATPEQWMRNDYSDKFRFEESSRFCIAGALDYIADPDSHLTRKLNHFCYEALRAETPGGRPIKFNDDPKTTHQDVLALLDRAIEAAS